MIPPTTEQTKAIHSEYCRLANVEHSYTMQSHFVIEAWLWAGYTIDDLRLVAGYIWNRIKDGKRQIESFKFTILFGDGPKFADDLSMARAGSRRRTGDLNKESVLRVTGRPMQSTPPAMSAGEVMVQHKEMANMLKEWKEQNLI